MKARSWTNAPDRTFTSREQAAAFYACLVWMREWTRRLKTGQAMTTIEEVCRESVKRAGNARIEVGDIPEEGDELDRLDMQDMPSIEVLQRSQTTPEGLPGNRASDIPALPRWAVCGEGQERQSNPVVERNFDRLIHELECGEGEGR